VNCIYYLHKEIDVIISIYLWHSEYSIVYNNVFFCGIIKQMK